MTLPVVGTVTTAVSASGTETSTVISGHVQDSGSDTGLLVFVERALGSFTSVTWDSGGASEQALTQLFADNFFNTRIAIYGFAGLSPATKDITIVHTSGEVLAAAVSLTNVDQITSWSSALTADVTGTDVSLSGFTADANDLLIGLVGNAYSATSYTPDGGFTEHADFNGVTYTDTLAVLSKANSASLDATQAVSGGGIVAGITVYGTAGQSITSINGGSAVTDGQQDVAVVASGFSALPTAGVIDDDATGTFDTTVTSSLAGTATNFTFDLPSVKDYTVATLGSPFTTASHALSATFTYSAETADGALTLNPATNWNVRELSSPLTTEGYLFYVAGGWDLAAPANADQILFYSTETVDTGAADYFNITAAGLITTNIATGSVAGQFFDQTDGKWYPFTVFLGSSLTTAAKNNAFLINYLGWKRNVSR